MWNGNAVSVGVFSWPPHRVVGTSAGKLLRRAARHPSRPRNPTIASAIVFGSHPLPRP